MNQLTVSGDGAIGVQVDGTGNSVTIFAAGSALHMEMLHKRKLDQPRSLQDLLISDARVTTLVGRDADLAALASWCASDAPVAVRTLIGRAGSGKTRLAIEACAAAEQDGWVAGFVDGRQLQRFHAQQNLASWRSPKPTLIVVDEAAASARILKDWFTALARQRAPGPDAPPAARLRILLLERHAEAEFGWWADLARPESSASAGAEQFMRGERPVVLPPLAEAAMRRALLTEAMGHAAAILGKGKAALPAPGVDPSFDALIGNDARLENEPLFLIMAAIAGVERGAPAALALGKVDLAEDVATIERARLTRLGIAGGLDTDGELIGHLAAVLTLQRGCTFDTLVPLIKTEQAAMELSHAVSSQKIAKLLRDALTNDGTRFSGLKPDMIGGAFLVHEIASEFRSDAVKQAIINRAWSRTGMPVAETLILAAQDLAAGKADHPAVVWLGGLALEVEDPEQLSAMIDALPQGTLALSELAAAWQQRLVDARRQEFSPGDVSTAPDLAASLNNLANRLFGLGQREEALAAADEAVALRRHLAAARPDIFAPDLAMSLNNLANCLSELGQREEALEAADEAVALRRHLAVARPDVFAPTLATSLNNLANCLSALGQREAALAAAEETVGLYRQLAAARPDAFAPNLARSLSVLGDMLEAAGRLEGACAADNEAVATLGAPFLALPGAHAGLMLAICKDYVRRHAAAGRPLDEALLGPIVAVFERMQAGEK